MKKNLGLAALALLLAGSAFGGIINVPGDYALIHDAVQACPAGDTVQVAPGIYGDCTHPTEGEGSTPACVIMKSGVTLRGSGPTETIIDVDGLGRGIFVELVDNCRIENLSVIDAFAEVFGAGILLRQVDDTVEITDVNITENLDGGIICINSASPIITRVYFENNVAKQGGGLSIEENCSPVVTDCDFHGNQAPSGAGLFIRQNSNPVISGCDVFNNIINFDYGSGGGIAVLNASPTISDCHIEGNVALGYGSGIAFLDQAGGSLTNCVITGNNLPSPGLAGAGIHTNESNPLIENCLITNNVVTATYGEGGGADFSFSPYPTVRNCTFDGNSTGPNGSGGGISFQFGADVMLEKCIVSNSLTGMGLYCLGANPTITCSDIWGNAGGNGLCGTDGGNNFSLDPLFCGSEGIEFNIEPDSPCAPEHSACGERVGYGTVGCVVDAPDLPVMAARLLGNAPNPFNPSTRIFYELDEAGFTTLRIYDVTGRTVDLLDLGLVSAGRHEVSWDGRDKNGSPLSSGVYFYEMDALGSKQARRMILIK